MIIDVPAHHPKLIAALRLLRGKTHRLLVSIDGKPERHPVLQLRMHNGEAYFKAKDHTWYNLTGARWTFYLEACR